VATPLATPRPVDALRLAHHHVVGEPRVPLRSFNRGVPEDLLQCGE